MVTSSSNSTLIIILIILFTLQNWSASTIIKAGINPCVAIYKKKKTL